METNDLLFSANSLCASLGCEFSCRPSLEVASSLFSLPPVGGWHPVQKKKNFFSTKFCSRGAPATVQWGRRCPMTRAPAQVQHHRLFHFLTIMIKNALFIIKPNDPKSRPDRNECEEWNIDSCDQKCENTDGSYKVVDCDVDYQKARELWNGKLISYQQCTCVAGYELTGRTHCQVSFSS